MLSLAECTVIHLVNIILWLSSPSTSQKLVCTWAVSAYDEIVWVRLSLDFSLTPVSVHPAVKLQPSTQSSPWVISSGRHICPMISFGLCQQWSTSLDVCAVLLVKIAFYLDGLQWCCCAVISGLGTFVSSSHTWYVQEVSPSAEWSSTRPLVPLGYYTKSYYTKFI